MILHFIRIKINNLTTLFIKVSFFFVLQLRHVQTKPLRKATPHVKKNNLCTELKILKCNECNKTFTSKHGFNMHSQHHTGQYSFYCNICNRGFSSSSNYKLHMRGHEGRGYSCDFCGRVFKSSQMKQYHESEHTGQYRFNCSVCNMGLNKKRLYEEHLASHQ